MDPCAVTNPRNPTSTPRHKVGHINKNSVSQGADTQQGGRASPYDPDHSVEKPSARSSSWFRQPTTKVHRHLPPTKNTNNNQIQFQTTQKCVTGTTGPTGQCVNRYSQPSDKGLG